MTTVGLIGLGAMGSRIAHRLLDAGCALVVTNRTASRAEELCARGAAWASTPRELAARCDVVMSLVTDDAASRAVWCDPEHGALAGMRTGAVLVESSTVTPHWIGALADAARAAGCVLLDAPVVGSRPQADAGALVYLVGGDAEILQRVHKALDVSASAVHHVGPQGAGATLKLVVNTIFAVQVASLGEMLGLAERAGLGRKAVIDLLAALPVTSPALRGIGALIEQRQYAPLFPIDLVLKDLRYLRETAEHLGGDAPIATSVCDVYANAQANGLGDLNIAGVARLFDPS